MSVPQALPTNRASARRAVELDETDRKLLAELVENARIPNNALAEKVGIAPSTCSLRVRRLLSTGVVRGFRADLEPAAIGLPIQAMIAVRLQPAARADIGTVGGRLSSLPGVVNVFFLAGADDFLIQVATASPDALRAFVTDHLNASREFASTETSLVFEHVRGPSA